MLSIQCENSVEFYKEKLRKAQEERGKDAILIMQLESMKQRSEDEKKKNLRRAIKAEVSNRSKRLRHLLARRINIFYITTIFYHHKIFLTQER